MNTLIQVNNLPVAFTTGAPSARVSDKYAFISTAQFIADVQSLGYTLVKTSSPRRGLGMHSMEFTHPNIPKMDGREIRLIVANAHDGTKAFTLMLGIFEFVCSNGMIVGTLDAKFRIVHRGYALDKVKAAFEAIQAHYNQAITEVNRLQTTYVQPERAVAFLQAASGLRDVKPLHIIDLQRVEHTSQSEPTAWNILNRVQARVIRGGFRTGVTAEYDNPYANVVKGVTLVPGPKAREITNVGERIKLNRALWNAAVETLLTK